jgi:glucose/arabinose dehydrogenase
MFNNQQYAHIPSEMKKRSAVYILIILLIPSCYVMRSSSGGGENASGPRMAPDPSAIALPEGYRIEAVTEGLTYPTGIAFDDSGTPYVTESGYSYGEVFKEPKLVKINPDGTTETIATGRNNGPWNGVWHEKGYFYISEGGQLEGGRIIRIDKKGNQTILLEGLPSFGDHHTNGPVVHDGYIYFGQGTATNSAIVGEDNFKFGWLKRKPEFHDIPCKDITIKGMNYISSDVFDESQGKNISTGAYLPFGTASEEGQVIKGQVPCTGAIMRIPVRGGNPELVAWGFRNPYGLAFDEKGQLYITENGYDDRGSRPVWGTGDHLWKVENGKWYGWPDFSGGHNLSEGNLEVPGNGKPSPLLADLPGEPPHPVASLGVHSSSNCFDFSRSEAFGFKGEAFIAQFGDMSPHVGKVLHPVGFKVVRVNTETGVINNFALNRKENAPGSKIKNGGIERPNAARFSPDGKELYIVDFGIMLTSKKGTQPLEKTGVIWKVTKETGK